VVDFQGTIDADLPMTSNDSIALIRRLELYLQARQRHFDRRTNNYGILVTMMIWNGQCLQVDLHLPINGEEQGKCR
jgi:hypothetical protein